MLPDQPRPGSALPGQPRRPQEPGRGVGRRGRCLCDVYAQASPLRSEELPPSRQNTTPKEISRSPECHSNTLIPSGQVCKRGRQVHKFAVTVCSDCQGGLVTPYVCSDKASGAGARRGSSGAPHSVSRPKGVDVQGVHYWDLRDGRLNSGVV
jgi:hypothetical protein